MMTLLQRSKRTASVLALVVLTSCMTTPVSGRKAFNIMPEGQEIAMGISAYQEILSKEKISNDPRLNELVTRVGQRIAAVADKPDYKWEFKVIDSDVQNAFCLPGGKIAVYRGILPIAKNEAGLATVMAHEVTHALARHGGQRISKQLVANGLMSAASLSLANNQYRSLILAGLGVGTTIGIMLPFSRGDETEADEVGQILMARAGYDPAESVRFWDRFAKAAKGSSPPAFLSTHPTSESRAGNLREKLPKAEAEYANAPTKYGLGESF